MPFPNVQEFRDRLLSDPLEKIVEETVFVRETPFAFQEKPQLYKIVNDYLIRYLEVLETNITVVGSAKIGFSLDPENFPNKYTPKSDTDVIIVDEKTFDTIWSSALTWYYSRDPQKLNYDERTWINQIRQEVFRGRINVAKLQAGRDVANKEILKPLRDTSYRWFNTFKSLNNHSQLRPFDIKGLLYRTWDHAMCYHIGGLRQIKNDLLRRG